MYVAKVLQKAGLATLLFDLLTYEEDLTRENRFDIGLLTERLKIAANFVHQNNHLPVGYFGASTGSAAALSAAVGDEAIFAIVSRGGRPDLAGGNLGKVAAPTLLLVGGNDNAVIDLNKEAQSKMNGEVKLTIIPGATHLFEEKGALEEVAELAAKWYLAHIKD